MTRIPTKTKSKKVEAKVKEFKRRSRRSAFPTFFAPQDLMEFAGRGRGEQVLKILHDLRIFQFSFLLVTR